MIGTIVPMVYGLHQSGRRSTAHIAHLAGAIAGGSLVGAALGWFGHLLKSAIGSAELLFIVTAGLALSYALHELQLVTLPMPQRHWQVPASWRSTYRPSVAATMYGFGLGVGFLTHVTTAAFYAVCGLVVSIGDPVSGAVVFGMYGLGRGLPPFALVLVSPSLGDAWRHDLVASIDARLVHLANGAALGLVGAYVVLARAMGSL